MSDVLVFEKDLLTSENVKKGQQKNIEPLLK